MRNRMVFVAVLALCACATSEPTNRVVPKGEPPNLGILKIQLTDYKNSGAYDRDVALVIGQAQTYITKRASEVRNPALVLDIDETSLSNWDNLSVNDFGFFPDGPCFLDKDERAKAPCGFTAWIALEKATPLDPTLQLFRAAKAANVAVFFISSRTDEKSTRNNLEKTGFKGFTDLFLRSQSPNHRVSAGREDCEKALGVDGDERSIQSFKTKRRAIIQCMGYTIIANIGDQYSDLDGGGAERTFKLPNPFYFIPP